jgi:hypothetical protein
MWPALEKRLWNSGNTTFLLERRHLDNSFNIFLREGGETGGRMTIGLFSMSGFSSSGERPFRKKRPPRFPVPHFPGLFGSRGKVRQAFHFPFPFGVIGFEKSETDFPLVLLFRERFPSGARERERELRKFSGSETVAP